MPEIEEEEDFLVVLYGVLVLSVVVVSIVAVPSMVTLRVLPLLENFRSIYPSLE